MRHFRLESTCCAECQQVNCSAAAVHCCMCSTLKLSVHRVCVCSNSCLLCKSLQFIFVSILYTCIALIWYTGHGEKATGNWCFKVGVISFEDLFALYMDHFRGKVLTLVCDCSYSGSWVEQCAMKLDEIGIPSCGHQGSGHLDQSVLLVQR